MMSSLVNSIVRGYSDLMSRGDQRLSHLPLMGSPLPVALIVVAYVAFATKIGPALMKNREPFKMDRALLVYNLLMVTLSIRQFVYSGIHGWFGKYSWVCQPVDYSDHPDAVGMAYCAYYYYISKIIELVDTVFFVLRKKFNQISVLHVSHHAGMVWLMYWGVKYYPGGNGSFQGFVNSGVHSVMYTYYLLAGLGDSVKRFLWWKRYLTQLQMAQFILILLHTSQLYYTDCGFPRWVLYPFTIVLVYFMFMFANFYVKAYRKSVLRAKVDLTVPSDATSDADQLLAQQLTLEERHLKWNKLHREVLRRASNTQRKIQSETSSKKL